MLYDKHKKGPTKGAESVDANNAVLLAKCGLIKRHHWSHLPGYVNPDTWSEPETDWHLDWKSIFHRDNVEKTITVNGIRHVMDARTYFNGVRYAIEFQHSAIKPEEIRQREEGYGNMVWVFDCIGKDMPSRHVGDGIIKIWWKRPRESVLWCNQPVILDVGDAGVYQVIAMPEYKNDFWYAKHCHKEEIVNTLTSGTFSQSTTALKQLIEEGAA